MINIRKNIDLMPAESIIRGEVVGAGWYFALGIIKVNGFLSLEGPSSDRDNFLDLCETCEIFYS